VYLQKKDYQAAFKELDELAPRATYQDRINVLRGRVYLAQGDDASAEAEFRKAVAINPDNYGAYILLGQISLQRDNIDQALVEVESLLGTPRNLT